MVEPLIYEISRPGRCAVSLPECDVPPAPLPEGCVRDDLPLPEVAEVDLVRHYVRLSQMNYGIDVGFYPLGSCTMKYNPKVNELAARIEGFATLHPLQPEASIQGAMGLMLELQEMLAEIGGFAGVTLQPAAGAHGELTGVLMMRKYQHDRGECERNIILVPDSAHGTNPATTSMSGLKVVEVPSDRRGNVDLEVLRSLIAQHGPKLVGLMLTNPNTLGLFDENVLEIIRLVHEAGGLVYGDGANLNAIVGRVKPGDLGFDVVHLNLHKTFSTPHGGGGPGAGPIAVKAHLAPFLPAPQVVAVAGEGPDPTFATLTPAHSIGRMGSFQGNWGVLLRAFAYIRTLGAEGLREVSENAVINANYLQARLKEAYRLPYDRRCMHEVVFAGLRDRSTGVRTLDVAKRLIDHGFHPPTIYFPLIVEEALMIEPTETESLETLDVFCEAMLDIAREAKDQPEVVKTAPHLAPLRRLDEATAARRPVLRWHGIQENGLADPPPERRPTS